jgi:hypothetical protein
MSASIYRDPVAAAITEARGMAQRASLLLAQPSADTLLEAEMLLRSVSHRLVAIEREARRRERTPAGEELVALAEDLGAAKLLFDRAVEFHFALVRTVGAKQAGYTRKGAPGGLRADYRYAIRA